MFAAAVALTAVVVMVSWHHVFPLLSTPKLEPVCVGDETFPATLCIA